MDIGAHIGRAVQMLKRAGCDTPRLDAELLLGHALGLSRSQLIGRWEQDLSTNESVLYFELVDRRARREPLPYIVGHKEFFGLEFEVDRNVLIPRPETELLVERAIDMVYKLDADGNVVIADIGTGSGVIAVSLALSLHKASIYAVDRSAPALAVAARNCRRHGVDGQVTLLEGDLLAVLPEPVDMIVANLPYIERAELETLATEVRCFEPLEALEGGADGLDAIRRLLLQIAGQAQCPKIVLLEIGATQGPAVTSLTREILGGAEVSVIQDYAGFDRIVTVRS